MSSRQQEQLEEAKAAGNEAFKSGRFQEAIKQYSIGIDISGKKNPASAVLFSNRALCHIKVVFLDAQLKAGYYKGFHHLVQHMTVSSVLLLAFTGSSVIKS